MTSLPNYLYTSDQTIRDSFTFVGLVEVVVVGRRLRQLLPLQHGHQALVDADVLLLRLHLDVTDRRLVSALNLTGLHELSSLMVVISVNRE